MCKCVLEYSKLEGKERAGRETHYHPERKRDTWRDRDRPKECVLDVGGKGQGKTDPLTRQMLPFHPPSQHQACS